MDAVAEIKSRLPIEQLVGQYCQLHKKGRNFVCLCPFHNDTHPSFLVSPDKGIAYCFACRNGGDIFSFYQKIEGCDFPQALKELADRAGVTLPETRGPAGPSKDEKTRLRECLEAAAAYYRAHLRESPEAQAYIHSRGVPSEQVEEFAIGASPDSFSATYEYLLKAGFSRGEILAAGLGVQRELKEERIYDRFRHRLMFPILDAHSAIVGFGGRTLKDDDAKYINSSEGPLFHKSAVLYGLDKAKDAIRTRGKTLLVEGYFDVLACRRAGAENAVATCGTALTEQHVKILQRYADTVTLCMDSDRAGQEAMERAFFVLSAQGMYVEAIALPAKDPADAIQENPDELKRLLSSSAVPYMHAVLDRMRGIDRASPADRRQALRKLLPLLNAVSSSVERAEYTAMAAGIFGTSEAALQADMAAAARDAFTPSPIPIPEPESTSSADLFSPIEITLGLFLAYPRMKSLLTELIAPEEGMAGALFVALKDAPDDFLPDAIVRALPTGHAERTSVLQLYCEHHGFHEWSETMALREVRKHCRRANHALLRAKQEEITKKLQRAAHEGTPVEHAQLMNQYQQVLRLMKMAS